MLNPLKILKTKFLGPSQAEKSQIAANIKSAEDDAQRALDEDQRAYDEEYEPIIRAELKKVLKEEEDYTTNQKDYDTNHHLQDLSQHTYYGIHKKEYDFMIEKKEGLTQFLDGIEERKKNYTEKYTSPPNAGGRTLKYKIKQKKKKTKKKLMRRDKNLRKGRTGKKMRRRP
jgi:hypothetical protein